MLDDDAILNFNEDDAFFTVTSPNGSQKTMRIGLDLAASRDTCVESTWEITQGNCTLIDVH